MAWNWLAGTDLQSAMRLALFGGSFDPIHRGHLAIARAAADGFALTTVLFAPTGRQPLKPSGPAASFEDRMAMVALACAAAGPCFEAANFEASKIDAPHPGGSPNYTVDTLAALRDLHPEARLYNLVGIDSFLDLPHWREPDRLLRLAEWVVVSRPGYTLDLSHYSDEQLQRIHSLDTVHEEVSATTLRERLHAGEPCGDLLPAPVAAYIAEHGLYRSTAC